MRAHSHLKTPVQVIGYCVRSDECNAARPDPVLCRRGGTDYEFASELGR